MFKKIIFFGLLVVVVPLIISHLATFSFKEESNCVTYNLMRDYMDENNYFLLWRGVSQKTKWLELYSDLEDRHTIIVEFDIPKNNNVKSVDKACIIASTKDTTFNVRAMSKLFDWYDKLTKNSNYYN